MGQGLTIERRFTTEGQDVYETVEWRSRDSRITNPDGSVVFEMNDVQVPNTWSQLATDILVSKYFRKAGVPGTTHEVSAPQVVTRIAHAIRGAGERFLLMELELIEPALYFRTDPGSAGRFAGALSRAAA